METKYWVWFEKKIEGISLMDARGIRYEQEEAIKLFWTLSVHEARLPNLKEQDINIKYNGR